MLRTLWNDEAGVIVSAELVLILTIVALAMVVGLYSVAKSVTMELNDLSSAFGAITQNYFYNGLEKWGHASVDGSGFHDHQDDCDCTIIIQTLPRVKIDFSSNNDEAS